MSDGTTGSTGMDSDHDHRHVHVDCTDAVEVLYHFLDGELTEVRRTEIRHHLEACLPCWEAYDFEAELKAFIARRCAETAPDELRRRVADALRREFE